MRGGRPRQNASGFSDESGDGKCISMTFPDLTGRGQRPGDGRVPSLRSTLCTLCSVLCVLPLARCRWCGSVHCGSGSLSGGWCRKRYRNALRCTYCGGAAGSIMERRPAGNAVNSVGVVDAVSAGNVVSAGDVVSAFSAGMLSVYGYCSCGDAVRDESIRRPGEQRPQWCVAEEKERKERKREEERDAGSSCDRERKDTEEENV